MDFQRADVGNAGVLGCTGAGLVRDADLSVRGGRGEQASRREERKQDPVHRETLRGTGEEAGTSNG